jgi:hypothetical protein
VQLKAAVKVLLVLQVAGLAVLAVVWWVRGQEADYAAAFEDLKAAVAAGGAEGGLASLHPDVAAAGLRGCRRLACIDARFDGSRSKWALASAARRGEDPCAGFEAPECTPERVRAGLLRVLARAHECSVVEVLEAGSQRRLRVRCGAVEDFVSVASTADGWRVAGEPTFPGLLPRLYAASASPTRAR